MARKRLKRQEPSPIHIAVGCIFLLIAIVVSAANARANSPKNKSPAASLAPNPHTWSARI
jgi:hypothetical protein